MIWIVAAVMAGLALLLLIARNLHFEERYPSSPVGDHVDVHHIQTRRHITLRGPDGEERRFKSLEDVPPEMRDEIRRAIETGEARTRVVVMENGTRHEYDSVEEMPPEARERMHTIRHAPPEGIMIEVNGERHFYESRDAVPQEMRRFLDAN